VDATRLRRRPFRLRPVAVLTGTLLGAVPAVAQREPAARLLPAQPIDPAPTVSRAAAPDDRSGYQFQVPGAVPAPVYPASNRPMRSVPQPAQGDKPTGILSGAVSGVKSLFGKPPEQTPPADAKPWWPSGEDYPKPTAGVRQVQTAQAVQPQPAPGLYAGPPAYRWYGYGSPTPGLNPYSPTGLYPKGSTNWYAQTGATPGAFPVPVSASQRPDGTEPPTYVGVPQPSDGQYLPVSRSSYIADMPSSRPEPLRGTRVVAHSPGREPMMPSGAGTPVASSMDPELMQQDLSWQPVSARSQAPIAASLAGSPPKGEPTAPPQAEPSWAPAPRPTITPTVTPSGTPSVSLIRGQAPEEPIDEVALVRSACFGRASAVGVTKTGEKKLHVRLVVPTATDGRDAAAAVSRVAELKAYDITFEATVSR
jgi:hypothetical protein